MRDFFISDLQPIGDYRAELGETPVWCSRSQSLLWVDILKHNLLRFWPATGETVIRRLDCLFSAVLLTEKPEQFLVVSREGIQLYHYDLETPRLELLAPYPADADGTRPNEAAIAPDGSLWFGTMAFDERQPIGAWYRYAAGDTAPRRMLAGFTIPNTLAWYGDRVWFADSSERKFYSAGAQDMGSADIRSFDAYGKTPDGSTLTAAGELINARFGHGCLSRFDISAGKLKLIEDIALPVLQPSCCAFGGPDRSELFITSARKQLSSPGALDGALLRVRTEATGAPEQQFKLA